MGRRLCSAYGLLCEIDFDWPWCPEPADDALARCRIHLGGLGRFDDDTDRVVHALRPAAQLDLPPVLRIERGGDSHYSVQYADGARFVIGPGLDEVLGVGPESLSLDDLLVYLQGPVLGFLLRLRGVTCLHASAAVVDGQALVVVGDSGMGKSTSAAAFAKLGLPVLTDDVVALTRRGTGLVVEPGLPRILLWPESVNALFGSPDALPLIVPGWEKRYLDLTQPGFSFAREPAPLGAIYVFGDRAPVGEQTSITPLTGTRALIELVGNTYANDLLDATQRARELDELGRVVSQVPVRKVHAADARDTVMATCRTILEDFRARQAS